MSFSKKCDCLVLSKLKQSGCSAEFLQERLIRWFKLYRRDLPWRRTYNPYHVWISEIMLQQTQMERGVAYFTRWIDRFPDAAAVAAADQQEILKYWEGLGYYSRARNLHKAAKVIVDDFGGEVVCDYDILLKLPGIGPYTAAAIASIAGNRDIAVIDANVIRVYARLFDIGSPVKEKTAKDRIASIARELLPAGKARLFNQAVMELGGLLCTPKLPECSLCPLSDCCLALARGTVGERPVTGKSKKIITVQRVAGIIFHKGSIFLMQRGENDVWGGLWDFPGGELELGEGEPEELVADRIFESSRLLVDVVEPITTVVHHYTRYKIILHCFLCLLKGDNRAPVFKSADDYRWVAPYELDSFGFPAGARKVLEYIIQERPELLTSLS